MNLIATSGIAKIDGMGVGVVRFTQVMEALSCAILNGGNRRSSSFFIMQVNRDYSNDDPASDAARVRDVLGLPEDSVGMMTAAEVEHVFSIAVGECNGTEVTAIATAGLSNHVVAGDLLENYPERRIVSDSRAAHLAGTINIAILSPVPLTEEGKVNILIPLVEAKSAAMADRGYRETGTTSDSMAVFSPVGGERISYTGTGSDIGIAAARAVRSAVGQARDGGASEAAPQQWLRHRAHAFPVRFFGPGGGVRIAPGRGAGGAPAARHRGPGPVLRGPCRFHGRRRAPGGEGHHNQSRRGLHRDGRGPRGEYSRGGADRCFKICGERK